MYCPVCGRQLETGAGSCPQCGRTITTSDEMADLRMEIQAARRETAGILDRLARVSERIETLAADDEAAGGDYWEVEPSPEQPAPETVQEDPPREEAEPAAARVSVTDRFFGSQARPVESPGFAEIRFGQKWLLIVGIVIMVLGVAYFLKYSFEQGWVGPAGRVASAYLSGMACLGLGEFFRRRLSRMFGLYLAGGGVAILYGSTFAAYQLYDLIAQVPSFGIMVLVTVLAGTLAIFYDAKWLAVLGIVGGFLTPVIISSGRDQQVALMTYMIILNGGILAIAFFKRWPLLTHLGMGFTWLLFSAWVFEHYRVEKFWTTLVYLNLFFLIYALAPFAYYFIRERTEKLGGYAIGIANSFIAFAYAYAFIEDFGSGRYASILSVVYAGIFIAMAQYLYRRQRENMDAFVLLLAKAMLFLVVTVPILFTDYWITIFWVVQAASILWAALKLKNRSLYLGGGILLALASAKFFMWDLGEQFLFEAANFRYVWGYTHKLAARWTTSAVVLAGAVAATRMVRRSDRELDLFRGADAAVGYGTSAAFIFVIANMEVAGFFYDYAPQARFASISVLWTLFSISFMAAGFYYRQAILRRVSLGLFAATVLKVFFFDMSNVSTPFRIVSFIVLGLMLIGASYLYHRYKAVILPELAPEGAEEGVEP